MVRFQDDKSVEETTAENPVGDKNGEAGDTGSANSDANHTGESRAGSGDASMGTSNNKKSRKVSNGSGSGIRWRADKDQYLQHLEKLYDNSKRWRETEAKKQAMISLIQAREKVQYDIANSKGLRARSARLGRELKQISDLEDKIVRKIETSNTQSSSRASSSHSGCKGSARSENPSRSENQDQDATEEEQNKVSPRPKTSVHRTNVNTDEL